MPRDEPSDELREPSNVPRVIHQIWWQGESQIPTKYRPYRDAMDKFLRAHPSYTHKLWDEASCLEVVKELFPQNLDVFDSVKLVEKCDMARLAILFKYGGIYLDMDFMILDSFDEFVDMYDSPNHRLVLPVEPMLANNCLIVSTPGNFVTKLLFEECVKRIKNPPLYTMASEDMKTLEMTGPHMISKALHVSEGKENVKTIRVSRLAKYGTHGKEGDWLEKGKTVAGITSNIGAMLDKVVDVGEDVSRAYTDTVRHEWFVPSMFILTTTLTLVAPSIWIGLFVVTLVLYLDSRMYTSATGLSCHNHLTAYTAVALGAIVGMMVKQFTR